MRLQKMRSEWMQQELSRLTAGKEVSCLAYFAIDWECNQELNQEFSTTNACTLPAPSLPFAYSDCSLGS